MTRKGTDAIEQLVQQLVQAKMREEAAVERMDMRAQNRWFDRSAAAVREILSEGDSGKATIERLMDHELPMVRMAAAATVLKWAPERALPVLHELLAWSYSERGAAGRRSPVASHVSLGTQGLLSLHYDIDINDVLPRVLGVEG